MNKQLILLLLLLSPLLAAHSSAQVHFLSGDLSRLEARGARENKLLFVYFSAGWCMPCQWMDKHTFSDAGLSGFLNEHYLSVKVDIDEPGGLREKERYRVKRLPTLLVIDTRGLVIARHEESLAPDQLLFRLREHLPQAKSRELAGAPPVRPELREAPRPANPISRPALVPERPPIPPAVLGHAAYAASPAAESPAAAGTETSEAPSPATLRRSYGVQVGVFSSYANTIRQVEYLEKKLEQPVNVFVSEHASRKVYRILIGVFDRKEDARQYAATLGRQSIHGLVKDLTAL